MVIEYNKTTGRIFIKAELILQAELSNSINYSPSYSKTLQGFGSGLF